MRTLHGSSCLWVKRVRVIFSAFTSIPFLDVGVERFLSAFPTSPILTCRLTVPTFSVLNVHGKKLQRKPCAPARWRGLSGRMADPAPNTCHVPNLSNFFSYMDTEHTPINVPDSHHNFPRHDDVTVISTTEDLEGLPHSGASSSSKQTAASRIPSMFGPSSLCKQMAGS